MAKRFVSYIPREQINKTNIIKLNTIEKPYTTSPNVLAAIENEIKDSLRLDPSPTMDDLCLAIANYYELEKENVFVGNGSDEILAFAFMGLFEPGNTIRFPDITYSFYPVYSKVF